jgi:hypothetical protein
MERKGYAPPAARASLISQRLVAMAEEEMIGRWESITSRD